MEEGERIEGVVVSQQTIMHFSVVVGMLVITFFLHKGIISANLLVTECST
jgi:hypothetical protein